MDSEETSIVRIVKVMGEEEEKKRNRLRRTEKKEHTKEYVNMCLLGSI